MSKSALPEVTICWFRRDLRLYDHAALYHALLSDNKVLPVFIFDPHILNQLPSKADRRVAFIHNTLLNLQRELEQLGSTLHVLHQPPVQAFDTLLQHYRIQSVYTNHDYEPYAIERDQQVADYLRQQNIPLCTFKDQVVFEKDEVLKPDGTPYTVFTPYSKMWKARYVQHPPKIYNCSEYFNRFYQTNPIAIPSLESIGFKPCTLDIPSPEPNAGIIRKYDENRNIPGVEGTSKLSVHLRFGTVSVRLLAQKAFQWNEQWLNELIWREFFMQVMYHFPYVVHKSFKSGYDGIPWINDESAFEKWCAGETGYPLVDAGMRQLNQTGWMHNRVRMVTASFLIKHLLTDWRWGEAYFAEKLLDYDLAVNNGNWQWVTGCGCDAAPYFRVFNPVEQQKKFDPDFVYIKRWISEYTEGYIEPIVEHTFARNRVLEAFKVRQTL
ncbi:MAG TPA: deoxyribodipyrimidine photo-lyase [Ferruginibacter sp.]|nr:deoxyribodipyrimidine photo-lyase [Ferruginibacter sp.]HRQ20500.1 deoxyribodipyrimidine photo-lyase [Ferruginibacter sp.]